MWLFFYNSPWLLLWRRSLMKSGAWRSRSKFMSIDTVGHKTELTELRGGSTLGQGARAPRYVPPDSLVPGPPPQIQKLADRSDVILRSQNVPKCKFSGSPPRTPLTELRALPSQVLYPRSRPFWLRFYRSQMLTHYRIGNHNDRFQM